jgi:hypothetical protein
VEARVPSAIPVSPSGFTSSRLVTIFTTMDEMETFAVKAW